jgi:hypothetical protein
MSDQPSTKSAASGKSDNPLASVLNVVPAVYYDLIARICPGLAFWLSLAIGSEVASGRTVSLSSLPSLVPGNLFVLVVLSYLSGIVLTGFSILWDYSSLAIFSRSKKTVMPSLGLVEGKSLPIQWQCIADKMEAIAKVSDDAGRIVAKALAEVALCQNLLTGLFALVAIGAASKGTLFFDPSSYWWQLGLLALVFFVAATFRQAMFLGRVHSLYQMHAEHSGLTLRSSGPPSAAA